MSIFSPRFSTSPYNSSFFTLFPSFNSTSPKSSFNLPPSFSHSCICTCRWEDETRSEAEEQEEGTSKQSTSEFEGEESLETDTSAELEDIYPSSQEGWLGLAGGEREAGRAQV